jgi:tRNA(adenine34) deaminase
MNKPLSRSDHSASAQADVDEATGAAGSAPPLLHAPSVALDPRDEAFMRVALEEAEAAGSAGDVPVGAVLVGADGAILARGRNRRELDQDPTAHAEVEALRAAARLTRSWRLEGSTIYTTLEPCPMCAGALVNARIARVVYGCADPKAGAIDTLFTIGRDLRLNHRFEVTRDVLSAEGASLLRAFFAARRRKQPPPEPRI